MIIVCESDDFIKVHMLSTTVISFNMQVFEYECWLSVIYR